MKVGDVVWVRVVEDGKPRLRQATVSSAPEHGWVGVRGLPRVGVVSVRVEDVLPINERLRDETPEERMRVLMERWGPALKAMADS